MKQQQLLDYVKENANDVSDLAKVKIIEDGPSDDPWVKVQLSELKDKYERAAEMSGLFS